MPTGKPDTTSHPQAHIDRAIAELRRAHPRITACHGALQLIRERGRLGYAMWLDIRCPQQQTIISGPVRESAAQAAQAALEKARVALESPHA